MAHSRNFEKSRKCIDDAIERRQLRRMRDEATEREVEKVVLGQHYKPEIRPTRIFAPIKRIFLDGPNLLIEIHPESAHVMPARG